MHPVRSLAALSRRGILRQTCRRGRQKLPTSFVASSIFLATPLLLRQGIRVLRDQQLHYLSVTLASFDKCLNGGPRGFRIFTACHDDH